MAERRPRPLAIDPLTGPFAAAVHVPGSKSIANRALVCAALASGRSTLRNVPDGDDTVAMVAGLRTLGIEVTVVGPSVTVTGRGGWLAPGPVTIDARLAGTTSRFLTALGALGPGPYTIDGAASLRSRPMAPLHGALIALGAGLVPLGVPGHLPVVISGGARRGGTVELPGDVSSQFLTALMLVSPLLAGGLEVRLTTPLVSRPYVELTASVMRAFGIDGVDADEGRVVVAEGRYRSAEIEIEPDASSAAYLAAAAASGHPGSCVELLGLGSASAQADSRFFDIVEEMGASVERSASSTTVRRGATLTGVDVGMADCSDAVPTVAVLAALAEGPSRIRGVGFIRAKESDRIGTVAAELRRCGTEIDELADGLAVRAGARHGAAVRTHDDHRLAMAFTVLGLRLPGVLIDDPDVVAKSFPGFWDAIGDLRRAVGSTSR